MSSNELPSVGEIKKDLELFELQQDLQPSLSEGEDLNSCQVTENGEPVQGNEVRLHIPTPVENQLEDVESPHAQDPMPQRDSGSNSPQARVPTPLRKRGRESPARQANNKGPRIRRSERGRIPRRYFQIEDEVFLCTRIKVDEPTSFKEAVDSPNHKEWMDVMKDEMDSMARNKVWELVDRPPQRKSIENKWVFKIKLGHMDLLTSSKLIWWRKALSKLRV